MVTAKSLSDIFTDMCSPNIPDPKHGWRKKKEKDVWEPAEDFWKPVIERYGFKLRVLVNKNIPPRHSIFSWFRGMGVTKYDELFGSEPFRFPDTWMLGFPESHCSVKEQASLIHRLVTRNRESGGHLESLDIITQSPMILSDCMSEIVSIISLPEKDTLDQDFM